MYRSEANQLDRIQNQQVNISRAEDDDMSFPGRSQRSKLQYFGHVVRADNLCTHVQHGIIAGKRRQGIPRRRWTDDIKQCREYPLQIVFNVQETGVNGDPWGPSR